MRPKILSIWIVSLLFGAMFVGMFGFVGDVRGAPDDWIERIIADPPENVNSVAVGDADNDGANEVVIGMSSTSDELRIYEKVGDVWIEDIIDDYSAGVNSVAIGDADNDGFNEIVAGLDPAPSELWLYKKDDGNWEPTSIANPGITVNSVAIGDADNDGKNEVVIGMDSATNEVRAFEKVGLSWNLDHTINVPTNVYSVAIGDADNDGNNEIVLGLDSAAPDFEVRAYEFVTMVWEVDNITSVPTDVYSVAIGDADNDGNNDVVIGLADTTNEVRVLRKQGASWGMLPVFIPDLPTDVNSVAVGDVDNDAKNEVLIGMSSTTNEVRAFEYDSVQGIWEEEIIADTPQDVLAVAIGDAYGQSNMEAVVAMASTTNEVRVYSLDRGELVFISHRDGDYVSGNARFEVFVTSNYVEAVTFYLGDEAIFLDTNDPYQFVLDTTTLTEDAMITIKAEGLMSNAPSLIDTVDVIVKNAVMAGDYITVTTLNAEYSPDQDVTVIVNTKTPPTYDSIDLVVGYTDPSGNEMFAVEKSLPSAAHYIVTLHLPSDAELGTYDVTANAYGYDVGFLIWEAENTTNFNVSGKNLYEQLVDMMMQLDELNAQHVVLNDSIASLSDLVENEHEYTKSEILDRINDSIAMFDGFIDTITTHDTEVKAIIDDLEALVENEHNLTKNELLSELDEVLSGIQNLDEDVASEAADIKTNLTNAISNVDSDLAAHDENLASAKDDAKKANEKHDTYFLVAIVLLIIAIVMLLVGLFLIMKGNRMLSMGTPGKPKAGFPSEETVEPETEVEPEIEAITEEPEMEPMEEIEELLEEEPVEEKPKKKSGKGKKK